VNVIYAPFWRLLGFGLFVLAFMFVQIALAEL